MILLIDSGLYEKEFFEDSFDFMLSHGLLQVKHYIKSYKVVFVGEVFTPYNHFVALPKNFEDLSEENLCLTMAMLKEFKNLRRKGKLLIQNKSFVIGEEIESDFYYWGKLYSFFMDYITYEFYYPKGRIVVHSSKPQQGRLNPMKTEINAERYGNGITYEVKDFSDDTIRNIYYTVLKQLEKKFASPSEARKISQMEAVLKDKGVEFKEIIIDVFEFINSVRTIQFNPVHEVIIKTLVHYFEKEAIQQKNNINVFYSKEFEYVYQYMLQIILEHDTKLRNENWLEPNYKTLHPDLITSSFIGDAKYYNLLNCFEKPFDKELYAYNVANHALLKNFVFIPSENNFHLKTLSHTSYRLEIVSLSLKQIFNDFITGKRNVLAFIHSIIEEKKLID